MDSDISRRTPHVYRYLLQYWYVVWLGVCARKRCPIPGDIGACYTRVRQLAGRVYFGQRAPDGQNELEAPYSGEGALT